METTIERDIIMNSYYIIDYFNKRGKTITNLKLQKLLYFLEAIYLIQDKDEAELFKEEFYVDPYGPISVIVDQKFRNYQNRNITLPKEVTININQENKKYIEKLFQLFGNMTAYELVTISHLPNSPWKKHQKKQIIPKIKTSDWFAHILGLTQ